MADSFIIPIFYLAVVFFLATLVTYAYYKLRTKKMDLIQRGLWKAEYERVVPETALLWGMFLVALGSAILVGLFVSQGFCLYMKVIAGTIPLFVGISLVICSCLSTRQRYRKTHAQNKEEQN